MAVYRVIYGLILTAALLLSQFYAGHFSSVLLISALLLPLISLIIAVIERAAFDIRLDKEEEIFKKGENVQIQISVRNRSVFPCSSMFITASLPDPSGSRPAKLVFSLTPLQKKTLGLTFPTKYRGCYEFTAEQLIFYDLFKLFKLKKKINITKKILVTPRIFDAQSEQTALYAASEDSMTKTVSVSSGEPGFVRKYTDGDDIKHIHWKLSSKQEDYMVWQHFKGQPPESMIICDMTRHGSSAEENALYTDAVLETALAICLFNIKKDIASTICYYDPETRKEQVIPVSTHKQLSDSTVTAAKAVNYAGKPSFCETAEYLFTDYSTNGTLILITHRADSELFGLLEKNLSQTALIITGEVGSNEETYLSGLGNVRFAKINPRRLPEEITDAVKNICGM